MSNYSTADLGRWAREQQQQGEGQVASTQASGDEDKVPAIFNFTAQFQELFKPLGYKAGNRSQPGWPFLTKEHKCKEEFLHFQGSLPTNATLETIKNSTYSHPSSPPKDLLSKFTMGGAVKWIDSANASTANMTAGPLNATKLLTPGIMSHDKFGPYVNQALARSDFGAGATGDNMYDAFKGYDLVGQFGAVFGSPPDVPWVEAALVGQKVNFVTTMEPRNLTFAHFRVRAVTPAQAAQQWLGNRWKQLDFAVAFSSIEHMGLGLHGEALDPDADLRAMRLASCLVKPGGLLFLSVPVGSDCVVWPHHRVYGQARLPMLTANWELVDVFSNATHGMNASFRPTSSGVDAARNFSGRRLLEDDSGDDDAWVVQAMGDGSFMFDNDSEGSTPAWVQQAKESLEGRSQDQGGTPGPSSATSGSADNDKSSAKEDSTGSGSNPSKGARAGTVFERSKSTSSGSSNSVSNSNSSSTSSGDTSSKGVQASGSSSAQATEAASRKPLKPQHTSGGRATILTHLWREGCEHAAAPVLVLRNVKADKCVKDKFGMCSFS